MENRENWILLALQVASKKGLTPAQLQKTLFLLQRAFPNAPSLNYSFQPYNYGPFDATIYQDAETLADILLVEIHHKKGYGWGTYHISDAGEPIAQEKMNELDETIRNYLTKLVLWVQSVSFQKLIGSIYKKYPQYAVNSIFRNTK